jgi:hypothetical protein
MGFATEWKNILTQRYAELRKAENWIKDAYRRVFAPMRAELTDKGLVPMVKTSGFDGSGWERVNSNKPELKTCRRKTK